MSFVVVGYKKIFGEDSVFIVYEDIELVDCFMIVGVNFVWCYFILFCRLEKRKEENFVIKVVVVDLCCI